MPRRPNYRAYILRLWRVDNGPQATWRASLQDVHGRVRRGFASLDDAVAYLHAELSAAAVDAGGAENDVFPT